MSATEDLVPVITVDWAAVEDDLGREVDPDLRRVIEHEGSTSSVALDKWGYAGASSTPLFTSTGASSISTSVRSMPGTHRSKR